MTDLQREQMRDEMGLSPQWLVRDQLSVARGATPVAQAKPMPVATPKKAHREEAPKEVPKEASRMVSSVILRAEQIAEYGWEELQQSIGECRACGLCAERKQVVPGVGKENARWLFIGEGPGAEEDAQGEPFVGPAGTLLDSMLAAIGLSRDQDVYITNAVKCRPPGNRTPETDELSACAPYLKRQIALIQPKLIVLLGRVAVHAVLGEDGSLASLRGKTLAYRDRERTIPVLVTYHPAYLLRTLPDKAKSWEDLCRARALINPKNLD